MKRAYIIGGIPRENHALYHQIRFAAGDPAAFVELNDAAGSQRILIIRDIECDRARTEAPVDAVFHPGEILAADRLPVDRVAATGAAIAEWLQQNGLTAADDVAFDATTPLGYVVAAEQAKIRFRCDDVRSVLARRVKQPVELDALREAQRRTESVMRRACETIAKADVRRDGVLQVDGEALTSDLMRRWIDVWLLELGCEDSDSIVAGGTVGADCHDRGRGELRTSQPVIVDIFPRHKVSGYRGDCTRVVVHGDCPDEVFHAHRIVSEAKAAAIAALRAGVSAAQVHRAAIDIVVAAGFGTGPFTASDAGDATKMVHGTGHGIGLEAHEAPLLVDGGPELLVGDVVTVEPGVYNRRWGGVRLEDMLAVTEEGYENFSALPEHLAWA